MRVAEGVGFGWDVGASDLRGLAVVEPRMASVRAFKSLPGGGGVPLNAEESRGVCPADQELSEYFVVMGISDCEYYSLDEILERARASNIRFNREVIKKVFLSIKPTHMDKCNGRQLKESYLKRRWELQTMLDTCSRELEALEQLRQQAENNLRRFENVASKYDQEESKLMIQVVSLDLQKEMDLDAGYKIHLECQDQVIETQSKRFEFEKKCVFWNELFSFEIERKFGSDANILDIALLDAGTNLQLGECSVILDELADQRKHELRKEIYGIKDEVILGSLLGVQAEEGPEDGGSEHVPERAGLSGRAVPAKVQ
ncbi:transmembrane domain-containing protein [Cryptosporidium canis]|uniref:Transmembrane domain-containing protein n=1 Tax=Cryptosporidium canis TaxID=195482 RepID=A0A9D5DEL4_9CRYT|nr:transmembrane domain-containing protein [Cryptosporidium canis]